MGIGNYSHDFYFSQVFKYQFPNIIMVERKKSPAKKKVTIKKRSSSSSAYKKGKAALKRLRSRN